MTGAERRAGSRRTWMLYSAAALCSLCPALALGQASAAEAGRPVTLLSPTRIYFSLTGSLGGPRFLITPERQVEAYEAQIMSQFGIQGVNTRTFRDEASARRLWVPGIGAAWDITPRSQVYFELGYGKGSIRSHQAFAETHMPGVPLPDTGALSLDARFTREATYIGTGACLYPNGKESRWSPFVVVGLGYNWTSGSGSGTLSHAGAPPIIPASVNELGWTDSGKGINYALGAGVDIRHSKTWVTSVIGRYSWGTARGATNAELDQFTLAVVASFDLTTGGR